MKAKLKLSTIDKPIDRMKIVYKDRNGKLWMQPITRSYYPRNSDVLQVIVHFPPSFPEMRNYFGVGELKQIVGEYLEKETKYLLLTKKQYATVPVAEEDWQYIIENNLIGDKVEARYWNDTNGGYLRLTNAPIIHPCDYARLTAEQDIYQPKKYPKKILYTEEEAKHLAWDSYNYKLDKGKSWNDWWENNKKQ